MKKSVLILAAIGLLQVLMITMAVAQSCSAAKSSCQKVTCPMTSVKQDDLKPTPASSGTSALVSTTPASGAPAMMIAASFLANPFSALVTKVAKGEKNSNPCCIEKGCDPTVCDVSLCDPARCSTSKK